MKQRLELIIFDLDGTLYPANKEMDRIYPQAAYRLLAAKTHRDIETVEKEFLENKKQLGEILKGKPTSTLTLFYFYDIGFAEFENTINELIDIHEYMQPDPETVQTIQKISRHFPVFLYTTNNGKVSERILNYLDLAQFFPPEKRFTFSDTGRLDLPLKEKLSYVKPGKNGFRHILRQHGVTADQALMVGDSAVSDITPAKKLGLHTYQIFERSDLYNLPGWLNI